MTFPTRLLACIGALALPSAAMAAGGIFVPLGDANAVIEIDTRTDTILRSISDVPAVHGLAATPDGKWLIAGSFATRQVGQAAPAKPRGMSDDEHASHHGGGGKADAKMAGDEISSVSVIDIKTGNIVRRIDVPGAVHHVAISANGQMAAVTHPDNGSISLIDLTSLAVVATIKTGEMPNYAAFSRDGSRLFVSNGGAGTISDIDTANRTLVRNISAGISPEHLVLSRDGRDLFLNDVVGGSVLRINTASFALEQTIEIGSTLHGIDLSDDEKTLYVAVLGDDVIAQVDLQTGQVTRKNAGDTPYHLMQVPRSDKLYLSSSGQPVIRVVDAVTMSVRKEIAVDGIAHQMASATVD